MTTITRIPHRPAPVPAELEASLEAYFRRAVRQSLGGMCVKLAPTMAGIPDRLVILPGRGMALVELKAAGGRLSAIQQHVHAELASRGTTVAVLYGRADIDAWIRAQFPTGEALAPYRGSEHHRLAKAAKARRAAEAAEAALSAGAEQ